MTNIMTHHHHDHGHPNYPHQKQGFKSGPIKGQWLLTSPLASSFSIFMFIIQPSSPIPPTAPTNGETTTLEGQRLELRFLVGIWLTGWELDTVWEQKIRQKVSFTLTLDWIYSYHISLQIQEYPKAGIMLMESYEDGIGTHNPIRLEWVWILSRIDTRHVLFHGFYGPKLSFNGSYYPIGLYLDDHPT